MDNRSLNYVVRKAAKGEEYRQIDLVLLFLLEGQMTVRYREENYKMIKEDIILINPGVSYEIVESNDALYGVLSYSMGIISSILKNRQMMFYCNSVVDTGHSYQDLRDIFFALTAEYTSNAHKSEALQYSLMLMLFDALIENYQMSENNLKGEAAESDMRMRDMMQYIFANLDKEISLNDLAEQMYVSASTLSRIFKKNTGVYFADYVMQMRVQASLPLLNHTEKNMTQIALDCGFANSASFNRSFRKIMGITPTDYRKENRANAELSNIRELEEEENVRAELKEKGYENGRQDKSYTGVVDLDRLESRKYEKSWNRIMNIGPMSDIIKANVQYHVLFLNEHLHYKYFRIWSIFSRKMMLFDGESIGVYNYDMVDQVLDFFVQHHINPYLDFGRRPDMAVSSGGKTVYYNEEYIPFKSREAWESLVEDFITHVVARYGQGVVSSWIFELTRDGGHEYRHKGYGLYEGDYDFFEAFRFFYNAIKTRVPEAECGGIGSIIDFDREFLGNFWTKCREAEIKPDFLSFFLFPYDNSEFGAANDKNRILSGDRDFDAKQVTDIRDLIRLNGLSDTKLYISEWNNSISNRNYANDSCFRAAYIVHTLAAVASEVDSISIMCGTDWVSSYMDTVGIANGGIGILTKDTIRKPAYYAIDFLNQLGEYIIDKSENYIVTKKENGDLYILCFNYTWFRKNYLMQDENIDIRRQDASIFEDNEPLNLKLKLKNLGGAGEYRVKRRTLNNFYGSILNEWRKFQYSTRLTRQDVKYLEAISMPNLSQSIHNLESADDTLELDLRLEPHEVDIIHIFPN